METETKTLPQLVAPERLDRKDKPAVLVLTTWSEPKHTERVRVGVDQDDLQAIVQQAYDQFGIIAEPSLEREAKRFADAVSDLGRELLKTIQGHADAAHEQQRANAGLPADYLNALSREPKAFA